MSAHDSRQYAGEYSDTALFEKLGRFARAAGRDLVEKALVLYLVLRDAKTPRWAKTAVIGALGYFIAPIDAVPDLIPGAGFADDLGVLVLALGAVTASVTPQMKAAARRTAERFFGTAVDDSEPETVETEAEVVSSQPI